MLLESFVLPLAKFLSKKGCVVEFACSEYMPRGQQTRIKAIEAKGFKVRVIDFDYEVKIFRDLFAVNRIRKFFKESRYDLIHIHTSKAGVLGRLAGKLAGSSVIIYTANDFFFLDQQLTLLKRAFYLLAEKISARFCDAIFFISRSVMDEAKKQKIKRNESLYFVGPPIQDYGSFVKDSEVVHSVRREYRVAQGELLIGCAARFVMNKGIDIFIRTAAEVVKERGFVKFIVVGDGPLFGEMQRLTKELGCEKSVIFAGFIESSETVLGIISSMDVFFLPTRREGFGLVYAEALAFEIPVVGPKIAPINEFVEDGAMGVLCESENIAEYKSALIRLIDDEGLRNRMGKYGKTRISAKFNQTEYFERSLSLYDEVFRKRTGRDMFALHDTRGVL